jgi:hypothetical protein
MPCEATGRLERFLVKLCSGRDDKTLCYLGMQQHEWNDSLHGCISFLCVYTVVFFNVNYLIQLHDLFNVLGSPELCASHLGASF